MAHQVIWTKAILDEFIHIGGLTEEEIDIMRTRVAGWSIEKQAIELGMSRSKVNYLTKRCKIKYDAAQKHSKILPPRKFSAKETYKDSGRA
jgi:DNA-binding CsgD family transcriptional regulator